ncbi:hypothetical protein V8C35DRAFT_275105 [Trichoderma chlorosporum]
MAPYTRPFPPDRSPSNVAIFADAARLAVEQTATPPSLADSGDQGMHIEPEDFIFAVSLLCIFFGFIIGVIIYDCVRKSEFRRLRRLSGKTRAGFAKVKQSLVKRPKRDADAGRGNVAADGDPANGTELTSARPFCGPMSDVELVVTPFELPFTETVAVENCDVNVADQCPVADHCQTAGH